MTNNDTAYIRNIAIVAHVDHGKTTLVDQLLRQSDTLAKRAEIHERMMDSMDLERERGITILAKNTAIRWHDYQINIVDTPGHADFGGEVERVLSMVDSVILLVDATDGPMPQTRFVTQKAFNMGLRPIVLINKIDRPEARPDWVLNETFDLFDRLGATDEQLDFPIVYASGLNGYAGDNPDIRSGDMTYLFETIVKYVKAPQVDRTKPFQMRVSSLDYSRYTGVIGVGRVERGTINKNTPVKIVGRDGAMRSGRILQMFRFLGLEKVEIEQAAAGDIISFTGIDPLYISDTLCDPNCVEALPSLTVDEPTMSMTFQVNTSPFAGREGKFVTSRQIQERLERELIHNVALRVEAMADADKFKVSGRGELHLSVLIETMRREGYELGVSRPEVIFKEIDGVKHEPYELVLLDIDEEHQGAVMERMGERKGDLQNMVVDGKGRVRLEYLIPTRGLIGFQTEFMTMTSGTGLKFQSFDHYAPVKEGLGKTRRNGVLIANGSGKALAYALFNLQERGRLFIGHGDEVYEGMIIGMHSRDNDLVVNPLKAKQLTNIRAAGSDENIILTPPIHHSLEQALEFIDDDELVEVTPKSIRLRKKYLHELERRRAPKE
ncbi:translational GTPase TypA [Dichelobacter nodosus]|uniref:Large ribosomal subunit assembly factor BipA n=1 Tax=Dichelobacter nodosus (strain VCS1703A) TaxID=246195 RepID=A5EW28_DICNV|nr:translational GTPase TypA [Dichelobacter nodosus]ABQ13101.1 GTP-binding protein TypA [Dichelobacter nodosus VCS1703A]AXM45248.1 translational GTPase TypA [Dichelobacter nodosus]KNZ39358.1 GTP-binding protein TypA [Dichelobacter nodosus]TGA65456.1 translational GTPase TypA [Dichelobacter nodosus]